MSIIENSIPLARTFTQSATPNSDPELFAGGQSGQFSAIEGNPMALASFVKYDTIPFSEELQIIFLGQDTSNFFSLRIEDDPPSDQRLEFVFRDTGGGGTTGFATSVGRVPKHRWVFVAGVKVNDNRQEVYLFELNGDLIGKGVGSVDTSGNTFTADELCVGKFKTVPTEADTFHGSIAYPAIWEKSGVNGIPTFEDLQRMARGADPILSPDVVSPKWYWRFSGSNETDVVNGVTLTQDNSPGTERVNLLRDHRPIIRLPRAGAVAAAEDELSAQGYYIAA